MQMVSYRFLMNKCDSWGIHLLFQLIKHGSKVEGLTQKEGDTPLHCVVENTLKSGKYRQLYLFDLRYNTMRVISIVTK